MALIHKNQYKEYFEFSVELLLPTSSLNLSDMPGRSKIQSVGQIQIKELFYLWGSEGLGKWG